MPRRSLSHAVSALLALTMVFAATLPVAAHHRPGHEAGAPAKGKHDKKLPRADSEPLPEPSPEPEPESSPEPGEWGNVGPQMTISCPGGALMVRPGDDLQAAINANPEGASFCLKVGVHRLQTRITPKSRQRFVGEYGAVVSGAKLLTTFQREGSFWVAANQTQQTPSAQIRGECMPKTWTGCLYPEDVFRNDLPLKRAMSLSALKSGMFYFDYGADKIYLADDPGGNKIEAAAIQRFNSGHEWLVTDVVIENIVFEKFANPAGLPVLVGRAGWKVRNNEIRWSHGAGLGGADGSTFLRNHVHNLGQMGLMGNGSDVLFEGNENSYNGIWAGYNTGWEAGGSKWVGTTRLTVRRNYVHNNAGPGLWTDYNNIYTLFEDNLVESNASEGIVIEISYDTIIRNNIVRRNGWQHPSKGFWGAGIFVAMSPNVKVYGNLVDENQQGITAVQWPRGTGKYGPFEIENLHVHDNVVKINTGKTGMRVWDMTDNDSFYTKRNNRFYGNTYYLASNEPYYAWKNGTNSNGYVKTDQWKAAGQDKDGKWFSL